MNDLIKLISRGGWQNALNIGERIKKLEISSSIVSNLVTRRGQQISFVSDKLCAALGTNARGQETVAYANVLAEIGENKNKNETERIDALYERLSHVARKKTMSRSSLREIMNGLNYLFDLPFDLGVKMVPYPNFQAIADRYGKVAARTRNLGAAEAGLLLSEACRWIYEIGPLVVTLVDQMSNRVVKAASEKRQVLGYDLDEWLAASAVRTSLDALLPRPLVGIDSGISSHRMTVRRVILLLYTAVFVVIASMNARRKGEIIHRKYGIYAGFISTISEELSLFEGEFYIEKSYMDYAKFYVNKITLDASRLLESLQGSFDAVDLALKRRDVSNTPARQRALFSYRRFSRIEGVGFELCWYEFDTSRGVAREFVNLALGTGAKLVLTPHMFRRFYALIYYYQYTNASLQALSQQLAHRTLLSTLTYITDDVNRKETERIIRVIDDRTGRLKRAIAKENSSVAGQMAMVSDELLLDTVLDILEGAGVSGGYAKYIHYVHRLLGKNVSFAASDLKTMSKRIVELVKKRGHVPQPMRHGQCNIGRSTSTYLANCRDDETLELRKELASAKRCSTCPFHSCNRGYLATLKEDLAGLKNNVAFSVGIERARILQTINDIEKVIVLHSHRIGLYDSQ